MIELVYARLFRFVGENVKRFFVSMFDFTEIAGLFIPTFLLSASIFKECLKNNFEEVTRKLEVLS
jgi:hypothetical protein